MVGKCSAALLLGAALALSGCGGGKGDVSGVVKLKGKAVPGGTITFFGEERGAWSSPIKADGTYAVADVSSGKVFIAVVAPMAIAMPGAPEVKEIPIPPRYADRKTSGLT